MPLHEAVLLGVIWLGMSVLIDAPQMLLGGPMQMTFGAYMADIGLTYAIFPVVTMGLVLAHDHSARR